MFGNVVGNCPTASGELKERRSTDSLAPYWIAMFIPFQAFVIIHFVAWDFRITEASLIAQVIQRVCNFDKTTRQIDLYR
ncbi:MAG TPA: hypothetical protein DCY14_19685 [Anaerolineae bacterium]|nr:hypothetical protein [Anaerolineae bacterium]